MRAFLERFAPLITGVLSGFDRLRLRGTRRLLANAGGLKHFLWRSQVLLTQFDSFAQDITASLCRAVEQAAKDAGRPLIYVPSPSQDKGPLIEDLRQRDGVRHGLIGVPSCVELCSSFLVYRNKETRRLELRIRPRKCLHYYHYYLHPDLGLLHTRFQTWFPFGMHVCLNGREWLARQLDAAGLAYIRRDNCFVRLADVAAAQALMDQQLRADWPALLDGLARLSNPIHDTMLGAMSVPYYWTVDQSEWATDILFRSAAELAALYPRLLRHGIDTLHSEDVMRFLGRGLTRGGHIAPRFGEEVTSDLQKRIEGTRLKHRLGANSLKMYDKAYDPQGAVLRLEATCNNVRAIKVFRTREGDSSGQKAWLPLRKSVADLSRRGDVSHKATARYAEALATVEDKTPLKQVAEPLCRRVQWKGRPARALNPLAAEDAALLEAVSRGEFVLDGFRNRDLRPLLYAGEAGPPAEQRRRSAALTRKLRLLRAHGLIQKVPKSHRYQVSAAGRSAIAALLAARQADTAKLSAAA